MGFDYRAVERRPDEHQPAWVIEKYFGRPRPGSRRSGAGPLRSHWRDTHEDPPAADLPRHAHPPRAGVRPVRRPRERRPRREAPRIRRIELVHLSHTDIGFTDHQSVSRDLHVRYLDIALDAIAATRDRPEAERFRWTAEATLPVHDWWPSRERRTGAPSSCARVRTASSRSRALPLQHSRSWTRRVADDAALAAATTRGKRPPLAAVQNDVNGFPRAGALALLDRGVRYLLIGYQRGQRRPSVPRPSAFWWKMPDGRRMLVWLELVTIAPASTSSSRSAWRRGPSPRRRHALPPAPPRREFAGGRGRPSGGAPALHPAAAATSRRRVPVSDRHPLDDEPVADGQRPAVPAPRRFRRDLEPLGLGPSCG